jgi:toxin ParE1/3/4
LENVRKLVIRRYPYLIYYMVDAEADELVVISIRHAAREREYSDA